VGSDGRRLYLLYCGVGIFHKQKEISRFTSLSGVLHHIKEGNSSSTKRPQLRGRDCSGQSGGHYRRLDTIIGWTTAWGWASLTTVFWVTEPTDGDALTELGFAFFRCSILPVATGSLMIRNINNMIDDIPGRFLHTNWACHIHSWDNRRVEAPSPRETELPKAEKSPIELINRTSVEPIMAQKLISCGWSSDSLSISCHTLALIGWDTPTL